MEVLHSATQEALTDLGTRYALHELCQIAPPYMGTRYNLETIAKTVDKYLSRGSFEKRLGRWLRSPVTPEDPLDPPGAGLNNVADALLEESEEEGIIPALWDRNRQIISLIEYQDEKQSLRERVVSSHEAFHSILNRALSVHCPRSGDPGGGDKSISSPEGERCNGLP